MKAALLPAQPLTDTELDRLAAFLERVNSEKSMTLEEMDGFFCALICGPELVPPSEYLPYVWGGALVQGHGFESIEEAQDIMMLINRHWNTIAGTLLRGELYPVLIREDKLGDSSGRDWALGFEHGMYLRQDSWTKIAKDKELGAVLLPIIALAEPEVSESDGDPLSPEERQESIGYLPESLLIIYRYFRGPRLAVPRRRHGRSKKSRKSGSDGGQRFTV